MATIITREVGGTAKGSPLTNTELDNNFININAEVQGKLGISPRVVTATATSGNLTINSDLTDVYIAEGLTGAITFVQPSGTPGNGQKILIRIRDNGTARSIAWTTTSGAFRAVGFPLPTTTVLNKTTYIGCIYNSNSTYWDIIAITTET